jgi:DNA repair protein RecO
VHHIHTSDGFIIGSKPYGEAGKVITIFTREMGLVTAIGQGIRLEKSKLRYSTQDLSWASFSLVKGKEFWRLVGADRICSNLSLKKEKTKHAILKPTTLILKRLFHGDTAHPEIFDTIKSVVDFIDHENNPNEEQMKIVESFVVIKILYHLGYVDKVVFDQIGVLDVDKAKLSLDLIHKLKDKRVTINQYINKALRESHL